MGKSVCFDVLGTCFSFEAAIEAIEDRLGPRLKAIGVDPKTLFFSWFYAAQRDFSYCSTVGHYQSIATVLKHTLKRYQQGSPSKLAPDADGIVTQCMLHR